VAVANLLGKPPRRCELRLRNSTREIPVDIPTTSAASAALRIGINILVGRRRPEIEFYYQIHNEYRPPHEIPEREIAVTETFRFRTPASTHRWQEIYVSFYAVNIGSARAENVVFSLANDFKKRGGRSFGSIFDHPIQQMAPGQSAYLFRLEQFDLYPEGDPEPDVMIKAVYDAAPSILNWIPRNWARFRKRKQYITKFTFNGRNVATDLPPPNYNG
jgi:hypothetical protein